MPGKWHPNTVRDLCSNPIIAGIKEYGRRSEGRYRRVGVGSPRKLEEHDLRPDGQPKLLENPEDVRVRASSGGDAQFDPERWRALQPKKKSVDEVRRKNGRKANNPDRYPLSTRVIDLTEGCGSVMHGIPIGDKLKRACGRYYNSGYTECSHNTVEAAAVTSMLIDALVELIEKAGGREAIREQLLTKARAEAQHETGPEEPTALLRLRKRLAGLEDDIATTARRMATEKDDARYAAIAKTLDSPVAEKAAVTRQVTELAAPKLTPAKRSTPEEQVDALMATIDDLATLAKDEYAKPRIRELVLRLGIFVGLEFEEGGWGKRPVRRLCRGVIAFGEYNRPVPIHGRSRADCPAPNAVGHGGSHHTHSAPACCRAPSAEPGSSAGEGTGNSPTDESNSGLEQTRQGTNVGATAAPPRSKEASPPSEYHMLTKEITRQELYDLVWETPTRHLCKRFGLSDIGLAKTYKRFQIPRPSYGYWAKKAAGGNVRRTPLPPCDDKTLEKILFTAHKPKPEEDDGFFDSEIRALYDLETQADPIIVADSLRSPHPLVARTRDALAGVKPREWSRIPGLLYANTVEGSHLLDITCGKATLRRALRIMDAALKGLEKRGYTFGKSDNSWHHGTAATAHSCEFVFRVREPAKRQLNPKSYP